MSAFTESALTTKLLALNSSQQSIQTLSLWLIHHRKHSQTIVNTWYRQLKKAPENKKLTFLYLANDVIQNSKKKGPEYGKEFFNYLPKVFKYIGEECTDEKLYKSLGRILSIWEERGVYDRATISDYRSRLNKEEVEENGGGAGEASKNEKKRKGDDDGNNHRSNSKRSKSTDSAKSVDAGAKLNGTPAESSVSLSPHVPLGDPPEPEELIEVLTKLMDNSAASDVVVREQIANFPKEISDLSFVAKLEDKEQAKKFSEKVRIFIRFHFGLIKFVERGFLF
ncbi:RPRD1A family protein [Megaselia abdita]